MSRKKRKQDSYITRPTKYICSLSRVRNSKPLESSTNHNRNGNRNRNGSNNQNINLGSAYDITLAYLNQIPSIFMVSLLLHHAFKLNSNQYPPQTLLTKLLLLNTSCTSSQFNIQLLNIVKKIYNKNYFQFKNELQHYSSKLFKKNLFVKDIVQNTLINVITTNESSLSDVAIGMICDYLTPDFARKFIIKEEDEFEDIKNDRWLTLLLIKQNLNQRIPEFDTYETVFLTSLVLANVCSPIINSFVWDIYNTKHMNGLYLIQTNNCAKIIAAINQNWHMVTKYDENATKEDRDNLINIMLNFTGWLTKCEATME